MTALKQNHIAAEFAQYVSTSVLGLLGISCYILADTYFIAQGAGSNGLAALNIILPMYNLMHATGLMIGIGAATRYSLVQDKNIYTQGLMFTAAAAAVFMAIGLLGAEPVSALLGADSAVIGSTTVYLRILLGFAPFFMLNDLLQAFVRNDGGPRLVMAGMALGSLFNIVFDYIFIIRFRWGMFGAALATGFSPLVSILVMALHFVRKKHSFHLYRQAPSLQALRTVTMLGASSFVSEVASGVVILTFNMLILRLAGNLGVAAYGVVANIALIVTTLFIGLGQGMQPLLSREYGRGHHEQVKQVYRMGVGTAVGMALVMYLLVFVFTDGIIAAFNSENDLRLAQMARPGMRLYFAGFLVGAVNMVNAAYFSAVDRARRGFGIALLRGVVVIVPVVCVMSALFGMNGIWLSLGVTELLVLAGCGLWDRLMKYKHR